MKTVTVTKLPVHHSGIETGYLVESKFLENCKRTVGTEKEAKELADYWERVALSQYH